MRTLLLLFIIFLSSCSKDNNENSICPDGDCWVRLYTDFEKDSNGFHHVSPEWFSETSGRFNLHIESSPTVGLFLIYTGFWGFYAACNVPIYDLGPEYGMEGVTYWTATNIYLTPTTLSGITFNFLMSLSGGLLAGYVVAKGDPFWTYSSGLAGIICASAGNDLYHPIQAMLIGAIGVVISYKMHYWVERKFKIDDAVGAVAVHGYAGFVGLIICGFVLNGYPASGYNVGAMWDGSTYATINPLGQFLGAIIMFGVLGLIPGYVLARILSAFGKLRIPREVEIAGLDYEIMEDDKDAEKAVASATR